ncbi:hypothetical protein HOLleu_20616 [Holothuria leucospilota]|uniref:Uncharacterized protein n=1 Tax=Holothuria leucospilota TaxID=206669 RepID=A0A9Q1C0Y1_HOLLE|nr:hypothetical protein HOLleu_20616 [Holothuria leucospilota]
MKKVWECIRSMSGYSAGSNDIPLPQTDENYSNELNSIFNRFDKFDFLTDRNNLLKSLQKSDCDVIVNVSDVRRSFVGLHTSKTAGPDKLSSRVRKLSLCKSISQNFYRYL